MISHQITGYPETSGKFEVVSLSAPCEICGDHRRCKRNGELHFCMTYVDEPKKSVVNGYVNVGRTKGTDVWGMFRVHTALKQTKDAWLESSREREKKRLAKQKLEQEKIETLYLTPDQRHEAYTKAFNQLQIREKTLAEVERRGFNLADAEAIGIKSVSSQVITDNTKLSGFTNGRLIHASYADGSFISPIRDYEGRIVAYQTRIHGATENKYRWGSSENGLIKIQPYNENPLTVFHPESEPEAIALSEGTTFKPYTLAHKFNCLSVGAVGGQFLSSLELLIDIINKSDAQYGIKPIRLVPDAGWATNPHVANQLIELIKKLCELGHESRIRIGDWNQLAKGQPDIDELGDRAVRWMDLAHFEIKHREGLKNNSVYVSWAKDRVEYTADITTEHEYVSIPKLSDDVEILTVKAGLGGGKTVGIIDALQKRQAVDTGLVCLAITHRRLLNLQTVKKWNLKQPGTALHTNEVKEVVGKTLIDQSFNPETKFLAGCPDSFQIFQNFIKTHSRYDVWIDEFVSVLDHVMGGGTLKGARQKQAIDFLKEVLSKAKRVYISDAHLTNKQIRFLKKLVPGRKVLTLENKGKKRPRVIHLIESDSGIADFQDNSVKYHAGILSELQAKYEHVLFLSDSQVATEAAEERAKREGKKTIRIDSKTSSESNSKEFMEDPGKAVIDNDIQQIYLSPSADAGISIDIYGRIQVVLVDLKGVLGVNSILQFLARLRDTSVPVYISVPSSTSLGHSHNPNYILKFLTLILQQKGDALLGKLVSVEGAFITDNDLAEMIQETFAEAQKEAKTNEFFIESLREAITAKYESLNLKEFLTTALSQEGHKVIDYRHRADKDKTEEAKKDKEAVHLAKANKIFNSEEIPFEEAEKLNKSQNHSYDVQCKIAKAYFIHTLPGIENTPSWTPELIKAHIKNGSVISGMWKYIQLINPELGEAVFKKRHKNILEFGLSPNEVLRDNSVVIDFLRQLGVPQLFNGRQWSNEYKGADEDIRAMVQKYLTDYEYYNLIGIPRTFSPDYYEEVRKNGKPPDELDTTTITNQLKAFASFFGLTVKRANTSNKNRKYRLSPIAAFEPFFKDILDCLNKKKDEEIKAALEVDFVGYITRSKNTENF